MIENRAERTAVEVERSERAVFALNRFGAAFQAARFYGPAHPFTGEVIEHFADILTPYISAHGPLILEVGRTSYRLEFEREERSDALVAHLVFSLYVRWVKGLTLLAGVTAAEIHQLIEVLLLPRTTVHRLGGVGLLLWERGGERIVLQELVPPEEEALLLEELLEALLSGELRAEIREELRRVVEQADEMGLLLQSIVTRVQGEAEHDHAQSIAVYRILHRIERALLSVPLHGRPAVYRGLAGAIGTLEPPVGPALRALVVSRAGDDPFAASLVRGMRQEDLARAVEDGLAAGHLPLTVARHLGRALDHGDERLRVMTAHLSAQLLAEVVPPEPAPAPVATVLPAPARLVFADFTEVGTELAMIRDLVKLVRALPQADAEALLVTVEERVLRLFRRGDLDALAAFFLDLKAAQGEGEDTLAQRFMRKFLVADLVLRFVDRLGERKVEAGDFLWEFFSSLRTDVIPILFHILSREERIATRRTACTILARIGQDNVPALVARLGDPQWFVVRNTIGILGQIKDPSTLPHIARALWHEELRVRREAMNVLAEWGTPEGVTMLGRALEAKDAETRRLAAHWLGVAGGPIAVSLLLRVLQRRDLLLRDVAVRREAILALGRVGTPAVLPVLHSVRGSSLAAISARHRALAQAAHQAILEIEQRRHEIVFRASAAGPS